MSLEASDGREMDDKDKELTRIFVGTSSTPSAPTIPPPPTHPMSHRRPMILRLPDRTLAGSPVSNHLMSTLSSLSSRVGTSSMALRRRMRAGTQRTPPSASRESPTSSPTTMARSTSTPSTEPTRLSSRWLPIARHRIRTSHCRPLF